MPTVVFVKGDHRNNFNKMMAILEPLLYEHGLEISFNETASGNKKNVIAILVHQASKQFIQSVKPIKQGGGEELLDVLCKLVSMLTGFVSTYNSSGCDSFNRKVHHLRKKVSYTDIEDYSWCCRCLYLKRNFGVYKPNDEEFFRRFNLIDQLMKSYFDQYRKESYSESARPPLLIEHGIDAIPYDHKDLAEWRDYKRGIGSIDRFNNIELNGVIDDIWINSQGQLIIVEYKTSQNKNPFRVDLRHIQQVSFYTYLLKERCLNLCDTGYIVYLNIIPALTGQDVLNFKCELQKVKIDYSWVNKKVRSIRDCLDQREIPAAGKSCALCKYFNNRKIKMGNT
jgi:CRISPR/Cas system-associated exonuclease Cas4 (RecB family)